jgi:hypothetical protein
VVKIEAPLGPPLGTGSESVTFTLCKPIAAFEIPSTQTSHLEHGALSELASGTVLKVYGRGFSNQAARVFANGRYYFVFLRDIETSVV